MSPTPRSLLVITALGLLSTAGAHAQNDTLRHGFWFGVDLGGGSMEFSCDTCMSDSRVGGFSGGLSLGATLTPHARLGADLRGWQHGLSSDRAPRIVTAMMLLDYFPRIRGGPFAEGGGGYSNYSLVKESGDPLELDHVDTTYHSGKGWGYALGAGWDFQSAGFTPRIVFLRGIVGTLHSPSGSPVATGSKQSLLLIEACFRFGL